MLSTNMVVKLEIIKEKFFAEITPRMRQDFSAFLITRIAILNMISKILQMVYTLFSYKDSAPF